MKKGIIVSAILCALSAVGGAAGGYFFAKKKLRKEFEQKADEEVESVREALKTYYETNWEKKKKLSEESCNKTTDTLYKYSGLSVNTDQSDEEETNETQESIEALDLTHDKDLYANRDEYEVVSDEELYNNEEGFDVIDLVYYGGTNLRDESTDDPVDIDESIGRDSLNYIGQYKTSMLFVRNNKQRTYYEVYVDDTNYLRIRNEGKKIRDSYQS